MKKFYKLFILALIFISFDSFGVVTSFTFSTEQPVCPGDLGRAFRTSVTGTGAGPYQFQWNDVTTPGIVLTGDTVNIGAGTYRVRVFDFSDNSISFPQFFIINNPFQVTPILTPDSVSCFGLCDGSIALQVVGGTSPYSFVWNDPAMTSGSTNFDDTLRNLCIGNYEVTVTDANGCVAIENVDVFGPTQIVPMLTTTNVDCNGNNNGTATANPTGGAGNYTFSWSSDPGNTTSMETGLGIGSFTLTVTDGDGCSVTQNFSITEPPPMMLTVTTSDVACFGESTGRATAMVNGGTAPYTYTWPAVGNPFMDMTTDLPAGNYTVTVTDDNGCTQSENFTIGTRPEIILTSDSIDVDCNGNSTGEAAFTITGGTPNYSWVWSTTDNGSGTPSGTRVATSGLPAGTYTITVTDGLGCTKVDSVVVNEPMPLVVTVDGQTDPSCVSGTDGSIDIAVTGGTMPYGFLWEDGITTTEDRMGLGAGNYSVTVTDANNCQTNIAVTLNDPAPILGNLLLTDPQCNGGTDGTATAVPSGGSGIYTNYQWSSNNGVDSIETGLGQGNYTVTITDSDGCTTVENFTIGEPAAISIMLTTSDVACFGATNGRATAVVTGGTTPFSYAWGDGTITNDPNNSNMSLGAGNYILTVTDANNCQETMAYSINSRPAIVLVMDSIDVDCNGNATGEAGATISNGTPNYSWVWSNNDNGNGVGSGSRVSTTGLTAATYTITVTDAFGCTQEDSIVVNEPTPLVVTVGAQDDPDCTGDSNGSISIMASGGVSPYTYLWSDNSPLEDRMGLPANTYTVTVTDANNCTATTSATLTDPPALVAMIDSTRDASCNGFMDGYARVVVTGGTGAYTFDWGGSTTDENDGIGVGSYTVTVSDANNCTTTATAVISEPTVLTATSTSTDASCSGLADGDATVFANGGTPGYTYLWSTMPVQQTGRTATNLSANTYTVTVTDDNGCTLTETITVGQPTTITLSTTTVDVSCNGDNDGSATVTINGGTPPLGIQWDDAVMQTTATASNLVARTYTVVVTDANGCNEMATVVISEPAALTATITAQSDPTCNGINDGSATAMGNGGTAPYSYEWPTSPGQDKQTETNLAPGTYTVTVTDDNMCTATAQVTLTAPPSVLVNLQSQQNVSCFGANDGNIKIIATGGTMPYTYIWDPLGVMGGTTDSIFDLAAGTYSVTVTDNNGCFITDNYTITEPNSALVIDFDSTDVSCNGLTDGNAKVNVTGGTPPYTYSWANNPNGNPNDSIFNLAAGTYRVTITDANSCSVVDSVMINEPNPVIVTLNNQTNVLCNGDGSGSASVSASGGDGGPYSFVWDDMNMTMTSTISGLDGGTYTVTVTDGNSCTESLAVIITEADTLRPTLFTYDVSCGNPNGGAAAIRASGGTPPYTYDWQPVGLTTDSIFNIPAGNYTVIVTDANGCDSTQSFTINSTNSNFVFTDSLVNDSCGGTCNGYIEILNLSGGLPPYSFNWSVVGQTNPSISDLCAGNYSVTISDATGCDTIMDYVITEPVSIIANVTTIPDTCLSGSGSASATATGGTPPYVFTWPGNINGSSVSNLAAGSYILTVTDANMCELQTPFIIDNNVPFSIMIMTTDATCFSFSNGTIVVSTNGATDPVQYNWKDNLTGGANPPPVGAGDYEITVTDANGCAAIDTARVGEPARLRITGIMTTDESCIPGMDGAATVTVEGGTPPYRYNWGSGPIPDANITGLTAGNYDLIVQDANFCFDTESFTIGSIAPFMVSTVSSPASCNGGMDGEIIVSVVGSTGMLTYSWPAGSGLAGQNPMNASAGTYTVTVTDATMCSATSEITVTEETPIELQLDTINDESCTPGMDGFVKITASGGVMPYTYDWTANVVDGIGTDSIFNLSADVYTVTVTDANSCTVVNSYFINSASDITTTADLTEPLCFGDANGSITITNISGGIPPYSVSWSNGDVGLTANNLPGGNHTATITDSSNPPCVKTETYLLSQPSPISVSINTTIESCVPGGDGTARVAVGGGTAPFSFNFSGGLMGATAGERINLAAGNYTVTVTDDNNCQRVEAFTILPAPNIGISVTTVDPTCSGGSDGEMLVNINGGTNPFIYDWSGGPSMPAGADPKNVMAGTYTILISDAIGCTVQETVTLNDRAPITATFAITDENCFPSNDGAAIATPSGGQGSYTYAWPPSGMANGNVVTNLAAGNYNVTITDDSMCVSIIPFTIGSSAPFTVTSSVTNVDCNGNTNGAITLNVTGVAVPGTETYEWAPPIPLANRNSQNQSNLAAGMYTVSITDPSNNCVETENFTITEPDTLQATAVIIPVGCNPGGNDGSIDLTTIGGTPPYQWNWGIATTEDITMLTVGSYTVTITDANNCQFIETYNIINQPQIDIDLDSVDVSCAGAMDGSITLTTTAISPTFAWSSGLPATQNQTGLSGGMYIVTVTDAATSCFSIDSIRVNEPDSIKSTFVVSDENCSPGGDGIVSATTIGGVSPYRYNWSGGSSSGGNVATNLSAGSYFVTITDVTGCTVVDSFDVNTAAPFDLTFTTVDPLCAEDSTGSADLTVTNTSGIPIFMWPSTLPDPSLEDQINLPGGTYIVTVTDPANGCTETADVIINAPDTIRANAVVTAETCNPGGNGAINITPTGGDGGPYTFNWTNVINTNQEDQLNLSAGFYQLTITDGNGCTGIDSFTVISISSTMPNLVTNNDGCTITGACVGSAKVSPSGGTPPYAYSWSGPGGPIASTMDSIGSLCAGNYSLTISDSFGCDTILSFDILPGRSVLPNEMVVNESCNVDCDGMVSVTPSGAQAPYTYRWNTSSTDSVLTGLCPGVYTVTITDASNCDTTISLTVGTDQFDHSISSTNLSCSGLCDGTADISVVGGSAGFTFDWFPIPPTGAGTANISDLCDGKYFVTITNTNNGCVITDSVTINPTSPILPNESFTAESCFGTSDATITLSTTGGAGNYSYNWTPNVSTTSSATGLSGGNYDITVTDGAGCDTTITVIVPTTQEITVTLTTEFGLCNSPGSNCEGKAFIASATGVPPLTYDWGVMVTTGLGPDTAINLCIGSYNVTVTDATGCFKVTPFTIGGPQPITANFTVNNSTCNICNGDISVVAAGGTGGYTYQWFDAMGMPIGTTTSINLLCADAYSLEITDNSGCSETFNTSVNDIGAETVTLTAVNDVSCFNGNDGSASISFTCNDPSCSVEWFNAGTNTSTGITTNTASNLVAGTYYVEVINNSGCKAIVDNIVIAEPNQIQVFSTVTDNVCGGGSNGAITLNVSGGSGGYNFIWSPSPTNGQGSGSVSGLASGTWNVTITDVNLCDTTMSFTITEPTTITNTFTTTDANCNQSDGQIVATVMGGTVALDYEYQWFDGNNTLLVGETSDTLKNVPSGNYALRVRDDNVCELRFTVSLNDANGPTVAIDSIDNVTCFGDNNGAVYITASGTNAPFTYNWLPNGETSEDLLGVTAGVYSVLVTDLLGCKTTVEDTVRGPAEIMANIVVVEATCGVCNGTATINATGGTAPYSFLWSDGSTVNNTDSLCGGNYSVVVTDANGCSKSFDFGVNTIGGPTGETVSITPTSCSNSNDGAATVNPIGGTPPYSYLWQHNGATTNTLNNLAVGTYFLQVSDVRSCSRTVQIDITGPSAILIEQQVTGVTCNSTPCDGSILLTVTGGVAPYSYNWGSTTTLDTNFVDNLCAGIYNVSITDANGCIETRTIPVSNTGNPGNTMPTITDVSCFGRCDGSLISNLSGSTTLDFQWFDNLGNAVGGINTDVTSTVCAGDYVLELTTIPLGCKSYVLVTVNQPDSITLSSSIVKDISCNGDCDGEIFINTRGGNILYSYSWNDPNQQNQIPASGLCAGTYTVTATDANGCIATTSVTLTDPPVLAMSITSNTNLICSSDCDATATSVTTGGNPPYVFNWSGGQTDPNPANLCFGRNILTVTDARNCSISDTIFISALDTVITESFGINQVCDGDSIRLLGAVTGSSITSFGWYLSDATTLLTTTLDTSFISPVGNYTYYLIATSGTCSDTAVFNVDVTPNPVVGLVDNIRLVGDEVGVLEISNEDPSYSFVWSPATNLNDSSLAEPTTNTEENITYTLMVTDTNGCTFADSILVIYSPDIEIPSGFSPNGDGNNDVWNIQYLSEFPSAQVQIYNRWGQLLFESTNGYTTPWDGTYDGKSLPIGTYYFVIDLKDPKITEPITGPVTIVR